MNDMLTTTDLAERLGLRPQTLRRWRWAGKGPRFVKLGPNRQGKVRYREADINTWLEESK